MITLFNVQSDDTCVLLVQLAPSRQDFENLAVPDPLTLFEAFLRASLKLFETSSSLQDVLI